MHRSRSTVATNCVVQSLHRPDPCSLMSQTMKAEGSEERAVDPYENPLHSCRDLLQVHMRSLLVVCFRIARVLCSGSPLQLQLAQRWPWLRPFLLACGHGSTRSISISFVVPSSTTLLFVFVLRSLSSFFVCSLFDVRIVVLATVCESTLHGRCVRDEFAWMKKGSHPMNPLHRSVLTILVVVPDMLGRIHPLPTRSKEHDTRHEVHVCIIHDVRDDGTRRRAHEKITWTWCDADDGRRGWNHPTQKRKEKSEKSEKRWDRKRNQNERRCTKNGSEPERWRKIVRERIESKGGREMEKNQRRLTDEWRRIPRALPSLVWQCVP